MQRQREKDEKKARKQEEKERKKSRSRTRIDEQHSRSKARIVFLDDSEDYVDLTVRNIQTNINTISFIISRKMIRVKRYIYAYVNLRILKKKIILV